MAGLFLEEYFYFFLLLVDMYNCMKQKYKSIKISEHLHKILKEMCHEQGLKLNWWCETMLTKSVKEISPRPFDSLEGNFKSS